MEEAKRRTVVPRPFELRSEVRLLAPAFGKPVGGILIRERVRIVVKNFRPQISKKRVTESVAAATSKGGMQVGAALR